jgi:EpsI family protein
VVLAAVVSLAVVVADIQILQALALLLLLFSLSLFLFGWPVTRLLLFPMAYLMYAIPVWFPLSPVLQGITADGAFALIRALDIPAALEDKIIVLPAGSLSVEQSCAGLNYLLAAMTLGTLYAYLNYSHLWSRLLVVLVAVLAAVLSNIFRVAVVVYLAYQTDMQHPVVRDHLSLGWILFAVVFGILLLADYWLHRTRHTEDEQTVKAERTQSTCHSGRLQWMTVAVVGLGVMLPAGLLAWQHTNGTEHGEPNQVLDLPAAIGNWRAVQVVDRWQPEYRGAISAKQVYQRGNDRITLFVGYYPVQHQGRELINSLNRIYNEAVWRKNSLQMTDYAMNSFPVLEQQLVNDRGDRRVVWYWYEVAGRHTISRYQAKWLQIAGLLGGRRGAAVIALAAWPGVTDHAPLLRDFARQLMQQTGGNRVARLVTEVP